MPLTLLHEILLTSCYAILISYLIAKWSYFKQSNIPTIYLVSLFLAKVMVGIAYGYVYRYFYNGGDTWDYLRFSRMIYDTLYINPLYYLELTFLPNARRPPDYLCEIIEPIMHWSDLRTYTILRINALIHLISGGYYSVHALFFAFFSFVGLIGIYKVFVNGATTHALNAAVIAFGIPSVWFWSSGVHKESLSVLGIGLVLCYAQPIIKRETGFSLKPLLIISLSLAFLLLLRPYIFMLLIPCLIAWYLAARFARPLPIYIATYFVVLLLALIAPYLHPKLNVFTKIVDTQYYYLNYTEGLTDLALQPLEPNLLSIIKYAPKAIYNVLIIPIYHSSSSWQLFVLTSLENIALLMLMFVALCRMFFLHKTSNHSLDKPAIGIAQKIKAWLRSPSDYDPALFWFCLFFALTYTLIIGLTNDNTGAIVRYRSTVLIFWVAACLLPCRSRLAHSPN